MLIETLTQTVVITYAYDAANRLTQVGDTSCTWDTAGRLVMAQNISHTVVYTYNGDGMRVAQLADDTLTVWVQDVAAGLPLVLAEVVNTEAALYLYGLGHLAQVKNGHSEWFLGDALSFRTADRGRCWQHDPIAGI